MINIEVIDEFEKYLKLEPVWNDLISRSDVDLPFLTFEWIKCWWKGYGKGSRMLILMAKEDNEIIGLMPLMIKEMKFRLWPVRVISFIANYHSNRAGLILIKKKEEVADEIFRYLLSSGYEFDLIYFDFIVKDSDTDRNLIAALNKNKIRHIRMPSTLSPYIPVESDWETFISKKSRNFRHGLNKNENKIKKTEKYEVVEYKTCGITGAVSEIFEISKNTWKYREGTAIASTPENIEFYSSLAEVSSFKEWLNIWVLKINTVPVAFVYNLDYKGRIFSLKIGFDEKYAVFSPSEYINTAAIKNCFDNKRVEYDWLGDKLYFKTRWTSSYREHYKYWIFRNSIYGKTLYFREKIISNIKRFIKKEN